MNPEIAITDARTDGVYDSRAEELAAQYERANRDTKQSILLDTFPWGARLLEIGSGSGADAAFLLRHGRDITASDASAAMLKQAAMHHPELTSRMQLIRLPQRLPFGDGCLDGVIAITVLMHLSLEGQRLALGEITRVLAPGGKLFLATFNQRNDLVDRRDSSGRLFELMTEPVLLDVCASVGLQHETTLSIGDALGRSAVVARDYIFSKRSV